MPFPDLTWFQDLFDPGNGHFTFLPFIGFEAGGADLGFTVSIVGLQAVANVADDSQAVLRTVDRWERNARADEYLNVQRILTLMGLPDGDLGQLIRTIRRLWNAEMFDGNDVSSFSGEDYMITGLRLAGQRAARTGASRAEPSSGTVVITQHGGGTINLGQVNTGQVRGNIETHLKAVTGSSAKDFTEAIRAFANAVAHDATLPQEHRAQILEEVDYLAEEAKKPAAERRPTLLARLLDGIPKALTTAESAKTAWDTFGPAISGFFGQPMAK